MELSRSGFRSSARRAGQAGLALAAAYVFAIGAPLLRRMGPSDFQYDFFRYVDADGRTAPEPQGALGAASAINKFHLEYRGRWAGTACERVEDAWYKGGMIRREQSSRAWLNLLSPSLASLIIPEYSISSESSPPDDHGGVFIITDLGGWPFPAAIAISTIHRLEDSTQASGAYVNEVVDVGGGLQLGPLQGNPQYISVLPLRPVAWGLMLNGAFLYCAIWGVMMAGRKATAITLRWQGRCPQCGHVVMGPGKCPECGTPVGS